MKFLGLVVVVAGMMTGSSALAQKAAPAAPNAAATKPANATGQCKDGTYWTDPTKSGACRGHHGIKDWYAAAAATPAAAPAAASKRGAASSAAAAPAPAAPAAPAVRAAAPAPAAAPSPAAAPAPAAAQTSASGKKGPAARAANMQAAPGGGPGLVWVNTGTNVYHCPGGDFYGKTKAGSYMSEADAKAKGARPDHNKPCTK